MHTTSSRLLPPLLAMVLAMLSGCGWTGAEDTLGSHFKYENTTVGTNVMGGTAMLSGSAASISSVTACGATTDPTSVGTDGTFAIRNMTEPCNDRTVVATLSNGVKLYSFWPGSSLPVADIIVTTTHEWNGTTGVNVTVPNSNNTFFLVGQLADINFNQFPQDAYLGANGLNGFLNRYFGTSGTDYIGTRWPSVATLKAITSELPPVTVFPTAVTVAPGGSVSFTAFIAGVNDQSVIWSVPASDGSTITATGGYTAPTVPGTYQVKATSAANPAKSGSATVTVVP
ncbi:MAG TPA: hypothetical protein VIU40_11615 [Geobacteraceae bacterium]